MVISLEAIAKFYAEKGNTEAEKEFMDLAKLQRARGLPETLEPPSQQGKVEVAKVDLRAQTLSLLPRIIEPSAEEKEALQREKGLVFLPVPQLSYAQLVARNREYYWKDEKDYANSNLALRDFVFPVAVEVGLREANPVLQGTFGLPRDEALARIEAYSQEEIEPNYPNFKAIMLPIVGYGATDGTYAKKNNGKPLIKNYFMWGLDNLSEVLGAFGGRHVPASPFSVLGLHAHYGLGDVGAVPAVVKIGNR